VSVIDGVAGWWRARADERRERIANGLPVYPLGGLDPVVTWCRDLDGVDDDSGDVFGDVEDCQE